MAANISGTAGRDSDFVDSKPLSSSTYFSPDHRDFTDKPTGNLEQNRDNDGADHSADDDNDNKPLLSSFFTKSVRMGPFSIRYVDPSSPRAKPHRLYEEEQYHDFAQMDGPSHDHENVLRRIADDDGINGRKCCYLPIRILLLSLYLAFTLSSFWILDSIKEPTLALLVNGELGKHQPRAKMVSFVLVAGLAVGMEWIGRLKQQRMKRRQIEQLERGNGGFGDVNAALERSWAERDLPNCMAEDSNVGGGQRWKKMGIQTSFFWKHFHFGSRGDDFDDGTGNTSSTKITTLAFYVVGSLYIHAFVTVAVALMQHPSFRRDSISNESSGAAGLDTNIVDAYPSSVSNTGNAAVKSDWYYRALGYILFALIESFGSVSITVFWAFANSHLTLETAERHYGSIVAVAQAGAIAGSTVAAILGRRRKKMLITGEGVRVDVDVDGDDKNDAEVTPLLIFWACGCIGAGIAVMALYSQMFSKPERQSTQTLVSTESREGMMREDRTLTAYSKLQEFDDNKVSNDGIFKDLFGGVQMIFRHKYLKLVLAVSVLYEIALTCMHYEMNLIGLDRFGVGISIVDESDFNDEYNKGTENAHHQNDSAEGITYIQFMGWYGQTVNVLSLFLSFYAFPRLIKHYGLRITIRIFPTVLLLVTIFVFVLFPENLYFLFVSLSMCKALTYSIHDPSEEILYMPTSNDAKFRAKFWIDVVGQRIAKAAGSAINNFAGSVEGVVKYGSLPSVLSAMALWLACYQVGILFDAKTSEELVDSEEEVCIEGIELQKCSASTDGHEDDTNADS